MSPFEEFSIFDFGIKLVVRKEVVVHPVYFSFSRCPGRAGDNTLEVAIFIHQTIAKRCFATTGWSCQYQQKGNFIFRYSLHLAGTGYR